MLEELNTFSKLPLVLLLLLSVLLSCIFISIFVITFLLFDFSALDLLEKMLQFNPDDRIDVDTALSHRYLKEFHSQIYEPSGEKAFNFDFEKHDDHSTMTEKEVPLWFL